jgi:para-nitrobenzyl esterase
MFIVKRLTATGILCAIAMMSSAAKSEGKPETATPVSTQGGSVSGTASSDGKINIYRGIPFAAPPVGDLRWRAPQPAKRWKGVLKADHYGASCMQKLARERLPWTKEFMVQDQDSEDCLYLNIWTPANSAHEKLPVFVWIHGGGFTEGSGSVPVYEGTELARTGLVVVTINYRLGVFGLLAHPELTAESPNHSSGNYGLEDQTAALQWIRKNIQSFGGDPNRVTIAGQSAGAFSVHAQIASPLAKGLFQRGIAESGTGAISMPIPTLAEAEKSGLAFAESKGTHSLKELRGLPAATLMPPDSQQFGEGPQFSMVVDGWFFPDDPAKILADAKQNDVPLITGWVANDYRLMSGATLSAEEFRKQATERYGPMAEDFLKLYPAGSDADAVQSQMESARDRSRVSMYVWVLRRARTSKTPVYTYFFTQVLPDPVHPEFGAFHTGEVPYLFRNLAIFDRPFKPVDHRVSDVISAYWKDFAETGNPNGAALPEWAPASAGNATTMEIGEHTGQIPLASPEKLKFWINYFDSPQSKNAPMF